MEESKSENIKVMLAVATSLIAGAVLCAINNYQSNSLKRAMDVFKMTFNKNSSK